MARGAEHEPNRRGASYFRWESCQRRHDLVYPHAGGKIVQRKDQQGKILDEARSHAYRQLSNRSEIVGWFGAPDDQGTVGAANGSRIPSAEFNVLIDPSLDGILDFSAKSTKNGRLLYRTA